MPSAVFHYYLPAPDIEQATRALSDAGWRVYAIWKALPWNFPGHEKDSKILCQQLYSPKLTSALEKQLATLNIADSLPNGGPTSMILLQTIVRGVNLPDLQPSTSATW